MLTCWAVTPFFDSGAVPPLSAEYHNTIQPADPQLPPSTSITKLAIASTGASRMDFGDTSVINDAAAKKTIFLNHAKKEARLIPTPPPVPPAPELPNLQLPGAPPPLPSAPAPLDVKDLGKRYLAGHEVHGKQYVFPPPVIPEPPKLPELEMPEMAVDPDLPPLPPAPPPPPLKETVSEVWSSTSLLIPMLSRTVTSWGNQVSHCKNALPGEPDPALFEIPPDYKQMPAEDPSETFGAFSEGSDLSEG
jgi:hypothetical protein